MDPLERLSGGLVKPTYLSVLWLVNANNVIVETHGDYEISSLAMILLRVESAMLQKRATCSSGKRGRGSTGSCKDHRRFATVVTRQHSRMEVYELPGKFSQI